GPRLKRASGPLSEESAFQAETERWSGNRTRDTMINSHLLYPSELSFVHKKPESNRCLPAFQAGALHELHPVSSHGGTRHRRPVRAGRDLREPEPKSVTKERAHKVCAPRWQVLFEFFFGSTSGCSSPDTVGTASSRLTKRRRSAPPAKKRNAK